MHHHHHPRENPLEIGRLAAFDADLGDVPEDERRRKRLAYIEQALMEVGYGRSMVKSFGCLMVPFAIIPIFWPFLAFTYFAMRRSMRMLDGYVAGACRYWDIDPEEIGGRRG